MLRRTTKKVEVYEGPEVIGMEKPPQNWDTPADEWQPLVDADELEDEEQAFLRGYERAAQEDYGLV